MIEVSIAFRDIAEYGTPDAGISYIPVTSEGRVLRGDLIEQRIFDGEYTLYQWHEWP